MEENIAERLLRGSRNIDRMRREISEVAAIIRGLADPGVGEIVLTPGNPVVWETLVRDGRVSVRVSWPGGQGSVGNVPYDQVALVHENLGTYVQAMISACPELKQKLEPLFAAA